jgi:acetyl-CoA carboxylase carboxyl transferase subunit beta
MAEAQGVKAAVLLQNQIVDWVVPENPDAADEAAAFCRRMANVIESEISKLYEIPTSDLVSDRMKKYRNLGSQI